MRKKALRKIEFALDRFYGKKSLVSYKHFKDIELPDLISRELKLDNHRVVFMSDDGINHLRTVVSTIFEEGFFGGFADRSDVWGACRSVLEDLLSANLRPEDGTEFIALVKANLSPKIALRTFIVPIIGVELKGISVLELGTMKIVPASTEFLDSLNINHAHANVAKNIESTMAKFWLVGSVMGTESIAESKFQIHAELTVGLLAVLAGSMFKNGASAFRIGIVMSSQQAYGRAIWMSWTAENPDLTTHYGSSGLQNFEIDASKLEPFEKDGVLEQAFRLFQADSKTELEEAICRAMYWYSDAHREKVPVMKLIKYWSCVETFFSAENIEITKSVSVGLTSVLVFGGYKFIPLAEYDATKKRIVKLYGLRSKAVHAGSHTHVSYKDAAELSQWIAWMLITMIAFVGSGYTRVEEIKSIAARLDKQAVKRSGSNYDETKSI